jgi:hypothetical protein
MDVFIKRKEVREKYGVTQIKSFVSIELEALNPPADMGAMVGGGASGATSQLTASNLIE